MAYFSICYGLNLVMMTDLSLTQEGRAFGLDLYYNLIIQDISKAFNYENDIELIVRAHSLSKGGYEYTHNNCVLTIFSASNYRNTKNKGVILLIDKDFKHRVI